ncbi:MAG: MaoC family dehydratase [Rhodoblastus sp.]
MTAPLARGDKMPDTPVGPFDAAGVAAYAAASGDDNPLHLDPALAARAGFSAPPVHGMRLMAEIAPALGRWRPDMTIRRLSGTFVEPLLVGEAATLSGRVLRAEGEILVRVAIQGPRRGPSVLAEAVLVPRGDAA